MLSTVVLYLSVKCGVLLIGSREIRYTISVRLLYFTSTFPLFDHFYSQLKSTLSLLLTVVPALSLILKAFLTTVFKITDKSKLYISCFYA
jgi:hypothetical protein